MQCVFVHFQFVKASQPLAAEMDGPCAMHHKQMEKTPSCKEGIDLMHIICIVERSWLHTALVAEKSLLYISVHLMIATVAAITTTATTTTTTDTTTTITTTT